MAMNPEMDRERFEALAEAYGGDVSRWPAEQREGAAVLMAADPPFTGEVLARSARLDAALDRWRAAPARAAVLERILATAPGPRRRWPAWLSPAALGAGLAAACAAGVVAGVQLSERANASEVALTNTLNAMASPALELEAGA